MMVIGETIRCKKASEIIEEIVYPVNKWKQFADVTAVAPKLRYAIGIAISNNSIWEVDERNY